MQGSLTPQRVAGALKRAGFDASKSRTTSVRGWTERSAGFSTFLDRHENNGAICVTYHLGGHYHNPIRMEERIKAMKDALEKDGFDVQWPSSQSSVVEDVGRRGDYLLVRFKV